MKIQLKLPRVAPVWRRKKTKLDEEIEFGASYYPRKTGK